MTFTVYGIPQPQGSTKAFMPKHGRFPIITTDNVKLKPWRQQVAGVAMDLMAKGSMIAQEGGCYLVVPREVALKVEALFFFEKPKSAKNCTQKTTRPDVDKLLRGVLDALTGIVFTDDSQVVWCSASKFFGSPARAEIRVEIV